MALTASAKRSSSGLGVTFGRLDHVSDELALRACERLSGHARQAGDAFEPFLNLVQDHEATLGVLDRCLGVEVGKAGEAGGPVVDLGVVLHGAGAEWVAAVVGAYVEVPKLFVVGDDFVGTVAGKAGGALALVAQWGRGEDLRFIRWRAEDRLENCE